MSIFSWQGMANFIWLVVNNLPSSTMMALRRRLFKQCMSMLDARSREQLVGGCTTIDKYQVAQDFARGFLVMVPNTPKSEWYMSRNHTVLSPKQNPSFKWILQGMRMMHISLHLNVHSVPFQSSFNQLCDQIHHSLAFGICIRSKNYCSFVRSYIRQWILIIWLQYLGISSIRTMM